MTTVGLTLSRQMAFGCAVVRLDGRLDAATRGQVLAEFHRVLTTHPSAVIFDVGPVTYADPETSDWFAAMAWQADQWPGIPLVLAGADSETAALLMRRAIARFVRPFATVTDALEDLGARSPRAEMSLQLRPDPQTVSAAREFVALACRRWHALAYEWPAILIISELVTNAFLHAGSPAELHCSYEGDVFRLAVRDEQDELPMRLVPSHDEELGRGLMLIDQLARSWGVLPTRDGGKVIWCQLTPE